MQIQDVIQKINESELFIRFIETGAGQPISNEFYNIFGASKTVYSSESYYSKQAFEDKFGKTEKSVSAQQLLLINQSKEVISDLITGKYNTLIATTFQVGDIEKNRSCHGWISVKTLKNTTYYHISIHEKFHRENYIKIIGAIGVSLLENLLINDKSYHNIFIDTILNQDLNYNNKALINNLINCSNIQQGYNYLQAVIFKKDGTVDRIDNSFRDINKLIVYKGSFNPVTLAHQAMMEQTFNSIPGDGYNVNKLFCISVNTFDKGIQEEQSIINRIELLNILGYDVLVNSSPFFVGLEKLLRLKYDKEIYYVLGADTANRFTFEEISEWEINFSNKSYFNVFSRADQVIHTRLSDMNNFTYHMLVDKELEKISSTQVRQLLKKDRITYDELIKIVPKQIITKLIEQYND